MFVIPSTPEGSMVKIRLVLGSLQCQIEIWLSLVSPVLYHTPFASQLSIYYYYFVIVFFFLLSLSLKGNVFKKKQSLYYCCSGVSGRNTIRCLC